MHPRRPARLRFAAAHTLVMLTLALPVNAAPHGRLDRDVVPTFQSVRLDLDPARADYRGAVHMDLTVHAATDSFRLHARDMDVIRVTLRGPGGEIAVQHAGGPKGLLVVRAPAPLAPGSYGLDIDFRNDFDTRANSLYRLQSGGDWYAFTQFQADAAREAFPCWDEPEFKIPFQLTLTVPGTAEAVSNTPIEKTTRAGDRRTVAFARTPPLPSYLVAIAVGPFEFVPIRGMSVPGRVVTVKGAGRFAAEAARITPPLLAAVEKYFGSTYPYAKLDLLAVPEFAAGAMENPGAITYRDEILLVDPATAATRQRYRLVTTTAHELAHMWFGDLVTLEWWDDIWLNESFASWLGDKVAAEYAPQYRPEVQSLRGTQGAMRTDARPSTRAIRQPVDAADNFDRLFDALSYDKGQAVLGMLESWIGAETFRRGVLGFVARHAWKNATAADLWRALSEASDRDIAATTASFLEQPGVPLVTLEPLDDGRVRVRQRRFWNAGVPAGTDSGTWTIPVTLKYSDGRQVHTQSLLLASAEETVALEHAQRPVWIHGNADERGYYRWSAPAAMLERVAEAAPLTLDVRERVGFLGNLAALLDGGAIRGDEYLRILGRFADDEAPEVISALLDGWAKIHRTFVGGSLEGSFMLATRKLLRPAIDRFGLQRARGEPETVSLMRPALVAALAVHGNDPEVLAWARTTAAAYLAKPASVDPAVAGTALNLAARRGDDSLFVTYRRRFETTGVPAERRRFLSALAHFRAPDLIERALTYAAWGPLRPQEVLVIPREIAAESEVLNERVWHWFRRHHGLIAPKLPPYYVPSLPLMAVCCSEQRIEDARAFFTVLTRGPKGTEEELAKAVDAIRECADLRRREGDAVMRHLTQVAAERPPAAPVQPGGRP